LSEQGGECSGMASLSGRAFPNSPTPFWRAAGRALRGWQGIADSVSLIFDLTRQACKSAP